MPPYNGTHRAGAVSESGEGALRVCAKGGISVVFGTKSAECSTAAPKTGKIKSFEEAQ